MASSSRFWDRIADKYAKQPVSDEASYQQKLAITRSYLKPDMQVLEFGCGTGSTAIAHAPYVKHLHGIDISSRMIEIAQEKAGAASTENLSFEVADIDDFNTPDHIFDAVLGLSILHLLKDRDRAIASVYRKLKPGGVFVSSTVCLGDWMKFFKIIGPIGKFFGLMPLVKVFSMPQLRDSLTGAGFLIEHEWRPAKNKAAFIVARKPE